jgi:cation diffusion facilitator CzcD-associated flavoprotein CzcO
MRNDVDVAIIGAGPYGLSIAAYLRARHVEFRVFGSPMHTWINQMPAGMRLKSEGFASTLYDPDSALTLERFCREREIPYSDIGLPVRLDTFISYGLEFQRRLVPELEDRVVVSLDRSHPGFRLQLDSGETVFARKVVVAVGISHFQYLPPILCGLPPELVTHSSRHNSVGQFQGCDVTIIGAGASALDLAALLKGAGAAVRVVARKPVIRFHNPPGPLPRPWLDRVRAPMTGLGPGWRSLFCVKGPLLFHRMPEAFRLEVVRRHLGPAPAWFTKEAVVGHVELNVGSSLKEVLIQHGRVHLHVANLSGQSRWIETDHVIAGTGYQVDLKRLSFLSSGLQAGIRSANQAPALSTSFESSVEGLYFVGATAAPSFGPLLRFAYGARFTARRLSQRLSRSASRRPIRDVPDRVREAQFSPVSSAEAPIDTAPTMGSQMN